MELAAGVTTMPAPRLASVSVRTGLRTRLRPRWRSDGLLALTMTGVAVARTALPDEIPDVAGLLLLVAGPISLTWRRTARITVLGLTTCSFCLYQALHYPHPALPIAVLVAVYTVATSSAAVTTAVASGAVMVAATGSKLVRDGWSPTNFDDTLIAYLLCIGAACALGYGVQLTRARAELLRQQADRLAYEHAAREEQLLQHQRNRIARDLHDVVSHQVTVITALAVGAGQLIDTQPDRARSALSAIETAGRDALDEMRRLLRVLRPSGTSAGRVPQPSLTQLPELIRRTTEAGVPVELVSRGAERALPAGIELCAFRIVQEALTNTLKHAGPCRAKVTVSYDKDLLDLQVSDTGPGMPKHPGMGHGLYGMRERTALLGGRLHIDRAPGGGVCVHAQLPIDGGGR